MTYRQFSISLFASFLIVACSQGAPPTYPESDATYAAINSEVGCDSKYSDDKKDNIFTNRHKNHWMTWSGEIVLVEADNVSVNIDGKGTQDLQVSFADETAGYELQKSAPITVRFLMQSAGGCFLPFFGTEATIIRSNDATPPSLEASAAEKAQTATEGAEKSIPSPVASPANDESNCEQRIEGGLAVGDDFEDGVFLCRQPAEGGYWTDWYALGTPESDDTMHIKSSGKESSFSGYLTVDCTSGGTSWSDTHNFDEPIDKHDAQIVVPSDLLAVSKQLLCASNQAGA